MAQQSETPLFFDIALAILFLAFVFLFLAGPTNANEYDDLAAQATTAITFDGSLRDFAGGASPTLHNQTAQYTDAGSLPFWQGLGLTGTTAGGYVDTNTQLPSGDWTIYVRFVADPTQSADSDSGYRPVIWAGGSVSAGNSAEYITATVRRTSGISNPGHLILRGRTQGEIDTGVMVADGQPHDLVMRRTGDDVDLYLDGTLRATTSTPMPVGNVFVGGDPMRDSRRLAGRVDDVLIAPVAIDPLDIPIISQGRGVHPGAVGSGGRQIPLQRGPIEKWYSQGGPDNKDAEWAGVQVVDNDGNGTYLVMIGGREIGQATDSILQYKLHYKWNGDAFADQDAVGSFQQGQQIVWSAVGTIRPEDVGFEGGQDWFNSCDIDGDGINNSVDGDIDGDGLVNSQDDDKDGDGIPNSQDPYPEGNPVCGGNDMDGDGVDDCNDVDIDNDGLPNSEDEDDDGDGIPDVDDPTPKGSDCNEEPTPADPPPWWDPGVNTIESESVVVFPPGDIDGDGIPNELDDDGDGDGIPNYQDPDADGDDIPDVDEPFPPSWGIPPTEPIDAPPISPGPPVAPPIYDPPPYYPPPDPTAECDPCYYLAQIAERLAYDPAYDPDTGEYEQSDLFPELTQAPPRDPVKFSLPEWSMPDFSGGIAPVWYAKVPFGDVDWQYRLSPDFSTLQGSYGFDSGVWDSIDTFRNLLRLLLLVLLVGIYVMKSYNLCFGVA